MPAPEPTSFNNGSNGVSSYMAGAVGGVAQGTGTVRAERSLLHNVQSPFWTGPLRSPQRLQNTFAHECFMDELAARAQADPVAFRLRHLDPCPFDRRPERGRQSGKLGGQPFAESADE